MSETDLIDRMTAAKPGPERSRCIEFLEALQARLNQGDGDYFQHIANPYDFQPNQPSSPPVSDRAALQPPAPPVRTRPGSPS
jgi:hypothetical protein